MKKPEAMKTVIDVLVDVVFDDADFDGNAFNDALQALGAEPIELTGDDLPLFGAALEFFGGFGTKDTVEFTDALAKATAAVARPESVEFFSEIDTWEELGKALVERDTGSLPQWLEEYIEYEFIGVDYERDSKGKFTKFGFFAPTNA